MRRVHLLALPALVLALVTPVAAVDGPIEITPFVGYRWGGDLLAADNNLFALDVTLDEGGSHGIIVGVPLTRTLQFELQYTEQRSAFVEDDPFVGVGSELADVDVIYWHAGVLYEFRAGGVRPFVAGGLGLGRLEHEVLGVDDDDYFSGSLGGGVKVDLSKHVGLRLEGRGYWMNTADDRFDDDCDFFCEPDDRFRDLGQFEARVGLVIAF